VKRLAHKLAPNTKTTWPEDVLFFDTETIPHHSAKGDTRQEFRLAVGCYIRYRRDGYPDNVHCFRAKSPSEFWDKALAFVRPQTTFHLVAHNLAFDAQTLRTFIELPARGLRLVFLYESGATRLVKWGWPTVEFSAWLDAKRPIAEFEGKRWTQTLQMMDNCNLFPGSVASWGKSLGFPKLPRPPYKADDVEWWPYCTRDVEIMVELWGQWRKFIDEHKLGTFRVTIGSQAFGGFRHGYMHNRIEIHDDPEAVKLERAAYLGGRTEPFYVGHLEGQNLFKLDVNSMYPYVMYEHEYPTRLHGLGNELSLAGLSSLLEKHAVIADVDVEIDEPVYPVKEDGKNVYPVGVLRTSLCTPELSYALKRGWIQQVHSFAVYRTRRIFYWYVEHFYALKRQYGDDRDWLRRQLVKLLLNSLYGKFGQSGYEDSLIGTADPGRLEVSYGMDMTTHTRFTIYTAGGSVIKQARSGEGFNSFVAIAAHVTAYARMHLWSLIKQAGRRNVYYCDTDSVITNETGLASLRDWMDPDRLGYLKVEETATTLEIRAPKDYDFGEHTVRKGVPLGASLLDGHTFTMETWPSIRSHLADGRTDTYHNQDVTKTLTYSVDWGELQADGWVTPYTRGLRPLLF